MNVPDARIIHLVPEAKGWRLYRAGVPSRAFASIDEAVAVIPPDATVHLSLPTHFLLLERMKLPSTEIAELSGMAQLQLEKTLPFPAHEVSSGILVIERAENTSTLLSVAVRQAALETLCAPLRAHGVTVGRISPRVVDVAAACPPEEAVLVVYAEQEHIVIAIADRARLVWAHALGFGDVEMLVDDLPRTLLTAEMEGVSVQFSRVLLDENCGTWLDALRGYFSAPVEPIALAEPLLHVDIDLVPMAWRATTERRQRGVQRKRQVLCAAAIYLVAVTGGLGYLGWLKMRAAKLDAQYAVIRPKIEALQSSKARWNALEPAIDPDRATIELLYQLCKNLPANTLHLTEFDQTMTQWKVFGEAPSAGLAIEYLGKLKEEKDLSGFRITASPPALLPSDQAQFSIFGKR
jgi:hypothetical protein